MHQSLWFEFQRTMDIYWFCLIFQYSLRKGKEKLVNTFVDHARVGKFFYRKGKPGDSHLKECRLLVRPCRLSFWGNSSERGSVRPPELKETTYNYNNNIMANPTISQGIALAAIYVNGSCVRPGVTARGEIIGQPGQVVGGAARSKPDWLQEDVSRVLRLLPAVAPGVWPNQGGPRGSLVG